MLTSSWSRAERGLPCRLLGCQRRLIPLLSLNWANDLALLTSQWEWKSESEKVGLKLNIQKMNAVLDLGQPGRGGRPDHGHKGDPFWGGAPGGQQQHTRNHPDERELPLYHNKPTNTCWVHAGPCQTTRVALQQGWGWRRQEAAVGNKGGFIPKAASEWSSRCLHRLCIGPVYIQAPHASAQLSGAMVLVQILKGKGVSLSLTLRASSLATWLPDLTLTLTLTRQWWPLSRQEVLLHIWHQL